MRRIGIDLGTTNTCVYEAYFQPAGDNPDEFNLGYIEIRYENIDGLNSEPSGLRMPSVIYARKRADGLEFEFYLGEVALRTAKTDYNPVIINTKRLLCKDEEPNRPLEYGLTSLDIAQKLLEGCLYSIKMKHSGKYELRNTQYCITRPAAFSPFANVSIFDAANSAGFDNPEPMREPIAALLSHLYDLLCKDPEKLFQKQDARGGKLLTLVVDIGGGTTDVTIQEIHISGTRAPIQGKPFFTGYTIEFLNLVKQSGDDAGPIASANAYPAFGGLDFDQVIANHIVNEWNQRYYEINGFNYDWKSPEGKLIMTRLYQKIQDYKISLSDNNPEPFEDYVYIGGDKYTCAITPQMFYEMTRPLCQRTAGEEMGKKSVYGIILDTIRRSGYNSDDIDYMFVTGGMSGYRPIRDMLEQNFPKLKEKGVLQFSLKPLEDIARGAAVCNCYFEVQMPSSILSEDLMIDNPNGMPWVLVKRNSSLPIKKQTIDNFMELTNPANLYVDILRGDGPMDCGMTRIRRLLSPIPEKRVVPKGTPISVCYSIDANQAMDLDLIVQAPDGDLPIALLRQIRDVDPDKREEE